MSYKTKIFYLSAICFMLLASCQAKPMNWNHNSKTQRKETDHKIRTSDILVKLQKCYELEMDYDGVAYELCRDKLAKLFLKYLEQHKNETEHQQPRPYGMALKVDE